jgi:hypothetical protein
MQFKDYLIESADWVIEVIKDDVPYFAHLEKDGRISMVRATPASFGYVSKWRAKERALKVLAKVPDGHLVQTYGGYVYSSKSEIKIPNRRGEYKN